MEDSMSSESSNVKKTPMSEIVKAVHGAAGLKPQIPEPKPKESDTKNK
jgi:hypothetical protein